ncbi:hypothetical protein QP256_07405 [Aerococcus sp. UMB8487]|nr:hypothetical protein [Aerococcus sp. UMB8487]
MVRSCTTLLTNKCLPRQFNSKQIRKQQVFQPSIASFLLISVLVSVTNDLKKFITIALSRSGALNLIVSHEQASDVNYG